MLSAIPVLFLWLGVGLTEPSVSLDDLRMFPSPAVATTARRAAWEYHHDITKHPPYFGSEQDYDAWQGHCKDAWQLWDIWDDLMYAQRCAYTESYRMYCLKRLRDKIGYAAYYGGAMPPLVPPWPGR